MVLIGKDIDLDYLDFLINKTYEKVKRKIKVSVMEEEVEEVGGLLVFG
jgi:hypothetical protein